MDCLCFVLAVSPNPFEGICMLFPTGAPRPRAWPGSVRGHASAPADKRPPQHAAAAGGF